MNVRSVISSADQAVEALRILKNQKRPVRVDFTGLGVSVSLEGLVIDAEQHFFVVEATTESPSTLHSQFIWADTFSGIYDDDWCFLVAERFAGKDFAECRCVLESGWESMFSPSDQPN